MTGLLKARESSASHLECERILQDLDEYKLSRVFEGEGL